MSRLIEEWKPIAGFEGLYEVSDWGNVASLNYHRTGKWRLLSPSPNNKGYLQVSLRKDGKQTKEKVHLLVWDAFVGEDRTGLQVNHIDEDKKNCAVWNLNLMTAKQNCNWGTGIERRAKAQRNDPKRSKPVIALNNAGEIVYEFPSVAEAGRNSFSFGDVAAACRGCLNRDGNHQYKGLFWFFKE